MISKAKLGLIEKELLYYGFSYSGGTVSSLGGNMSEPYDLFVSRLNSLQKNQIDLLKLEWEKVSLNVKPIAGGINLGYLRILQKSINRLFKKTFHEVLNKIKISDHIERVSSMCADRMSATTAEQAAVILSKIDIYEHNIKRIGYIKYLVKLMHANSGMLEKVAFTGIDMNSSIQGPYSNLDLPMQERVFEWKDIDEETYARQDMKQKQPRYTAGRENQKPSDSQVGYYLRELRNEPYSFPYGEDEANYPYRKLLWGNP
jgi:hypothetical protein